MLPTIRRSLRLILLTMVRKSELRDAVWDEVDFENALWSIPKERMKRSKPHNVYALLCLGLPLELSRTNFDFAAIFRGCHPWIDECPTHSGGVDQSGSPNRFRRLLSNADAGTKRRKKLI
jgi:integrase